MSFASRLALLALVLAPTVLSAAADAAPRSGTNKLLSCGELGQGRRRLEIVATRTGVEARLSGQTPIAGSFTEGEFTFQRADWNDADFLSLEISRVNGRYIGVAYEPATSGPAAYKESVFTCAEIMVGSASSNGG